MQTKALKLRENFYWAGILDDTLRVFDIIMYTEFGTTYNSYIYKAGDKVILFETVKAKFFDDYLKELKEITDVTKIDYLVVNHTEPDHAGSVEKLLELNPQLKIIATPTAVSFLQNIVNRDFCSIAVRDEQEMQIGNITLRFLHVPNLHWPDTMYTYIEEEQALVTCDSFGSHYASEDILVSKVKNEDDYWKATKYYFDCIIGPFKPFMLKALERVRQLDVSIICTGHGPVLDAGIDKMYNTYEEWCTVVNPNQKKTVVMPYVSAYGYTGQLAEQIAKGIEDSGDIEVRRYDMVTADQAKVLDELGFADGILFGTPTIVGEALKPIWDLTTSIFAGTHGGKLASAFGSYGWSGEGVPHIIERLKQLRMRVPDEGFKVRFKPGEVDMLNAYDYGYNFGCILQDKENPKKKSAKTTLVKCLVCGEIFDSSLEVCPVCGVGKENFVPVEAEDTGYRRDTQNLYAIIGGGAAGLNAAKAIRERDKTGSIYMLSNEAYPAYNRPMLTKSLVAGLDAEQIAVQEASWYEENNVCLLLGKNVVSIDTEKKEIHTDDGAKFKYTKLIYALGSECFIPPIQGADQPEVIAIRRLSDTQKVTELLPQTKEAVVIGGGVLGLEAAWELKKARCKVTVLELAPRLMGRQLDEGAGEMIKAVSEAQGITIHTGVQIEAIEGDGHVTGVRLGDGRVFPAQLVIVSCGVRANVAVAKAAGIETDRAVVVNSRMETSAADVYACGDCAQYQGINYAIWPQAVEEGKTAGANAAGETLEYTGVPAALTFHGMNTALFAIGDNGSHPDLVYRTVEFKDMARKQYEKYYFRNNRLCGAILIGDVSRMGEMTEAVEKRASFGELFGK
ncbi:MAG TPA: FAD-dependent oxidoreductase [Candidatus Merdisoma faecalis]|uniref:FAD-dependent oxidoreductase n=1 Tax=Lachnoclostridium sp. An138 TaxID=1965560 RepID=UPI000B3A2C8D|nr:FAD-dependent oxidoreductase [Lachnoclostridium sp. An138]OUQ19262.1 pyridine nucleotide-disulfide oxidoreductase [Lachnoclostridium sp. An138]HIR97820.1 FAD-dependent oxidoreductase [Candidatus Merdisoma faecalis]